ncbi:MAG: Crp/Fnr family transcriptional regulator [Dehalococcoidia bacterium]
MPSSTTTSTGKVPSRPNRLLALIPTDELQELQPQFDIVTLAQKRFFLPTGEPLSHVYFPQSGLVSLRVVMKTGATVEVAAVGHEGMLGVSVLLEGDPPPFDMVCQVPGTAARLPRSTFLRASKELPTFRRVMLRYALALFYQVARQAACNRLHSVEQRLARWLLLCRDRVGSDVFPLTHETLAGMLGTGRPFMTETASGLEHAGLIQHRRGVIRIVDGRGLEAIACEDYGASEIEYDRLLG